ncbi:MAG TPA: cytochrome c3 family protein [Vicinamibacterales bacterium]|nr:cytochrome c3 family protein [Vicinamibacterales bacterium]
MLALLMTVLLMSPQEPAALPDTETCLACHSDPELSTTTVDGTVVKLHVDGSIFGGSVHSRFACVECHSGVKEVPHESRQYRNRRELTLTYSEQCRKCHFDKYTKTLDSVHQAAVARGDVTAPVCVDCHGSHDIRKAAQPRARISDTCSRCHEGVARAYSGSVHGRALGTAAEGEVPVCTDCHRSHNIAGPHEQQWELRTPEMCGSCHANEQLMKKYGLSTNVLSTYLADFHGKTASLRRDQGTAPTGPVVARCTDCHGVHDIERADNPASPVMKANLTGTCRQCHADANDNFPAAWLSHYEPSLSKAPIVYGVKIAYAVLIPFMIGGLGLQVLLHLWRLMVNR